MNITRMHVDYWRERQTEPRWLAQWWDAQDAHIRSQWLRPKRRSVSIDSIVNANGNVARRGHEAAMIVHILRLARHNDKGTCIPALARMAQPQSHPSSTPRRIAFARRWLARIHLEQQQ